MKTTRKEMLKGLAATIGLCAFPKSGENDIQEQELFPRIVVSLCRSMIQLAEKGSYDFLDDKMTNGYIVVPRSQEYLLDVKNKYGFSVRNLCFVAWPNMTITNPNDIDIRFSESGWKKERLPSDTWAVIDCQRYGDPNFGEDSFVLFRV
ncbi:MAG: hypothetical protein J6Q22_10000 [Prevotella sp.]|nr:hypothetical protein [Prevotella sp.]